MKKILLLTFIVSIAVMISYFNSKEFLKARLALLILPTSSHEERILGLKTLLFVER